MYALMIVPSDFPDGDAGAVRDYSLAKIYQEIGYDVILIGMGKGSTEGIADKIKYYSLYQERNNVIDHFMYYFGYKKRCITLIEQLMIENGEPSLVHINQVSLSMIEYLIRYCEKKSIPILHDSTEWYSPCEFKRGKCDKAYILKDRLNRQVIRVPVRVIAISEYLRSYFGSRGIRTTRIPVIMDVLGQQKVSNNPSDKIKIIYAGNPAAKDHLREIIEAVIVLPEIDKERIELHILGIGQEQLKVLSNTDSLPSCIKVYGRVPREKVLELMLQMDFSILLRPSDERYSKAGFPTKSVEAMMHGVAMVCNLTSDLGLYLNDGENAVVIFGGSVGAVSEALSRILGMERTEINWLKKNARLLAENCFDYRGYVDDMKNLIGR